MSSPRKAAHLEFRHVSCTNVNDIIAVASPLIGRQFFQNGGNTCVGALKPPRPSGGTAGTFYTNFTWVGGHLLNSLTLSSPFNPFADADGNVFVRPGNYIPGIPSYRFKAGGEYRVTDAWTVAATSMSSAPNG